MRKILGVQNWNLKKTLVFFISIVVSFTYLISLLVSGTFMSHYSTKQEKELAQTQLEITSKNFEDTMNHYYDLAVATIIAKDIQKYSQSHEVDADELYQIRGRIRGQLKEVLNIQTNIGFLVVYPYNTNDYIYSGQTSITDSKFEEHYMNDFQSSILTKKDNHVKMSINDLYFEDEGFTITFYHPIYSSSSVNEEQGILVINFDDQLLNPIDIVSKEDTGSEMYIMGVDGMKRYSSLKAEINEQSLFHEDILEQNRGSFIEDGKLVFFQRIKDWNYYLVKEIPTTIIYKSSVQVVSLLSIIVIVMLIFTIIMIKKIISNFHKPIQEVVHGMNHVANKKLDIKISSTKMDSDSRTLVDGFNQMIQVINELIEQIKIEQKQMEQIRFNTLQSQIKPHFLYNTLEGIHWQALAEDSEDIATMVEALAKYYRVCLSEGQEIITFAEEIDHIKSYLTIQNMRYDNIVELQVEELAGSNHIYIPKLTIQPLVENSIYHGMRVKNGSAGKIKIKTIQEADQVNIFIADNGEGMSQEKVVQMNQSLLESGTSIGYGIQNVNKRIQLLFGKEYGLKYHVNTTGGITVEISLPVIGGE